MTRNRLPRFPKEIPVSFKPDEDGYVGRECPSPDCKKYFKLTPGTGLPVEHSICPYCGTKDDNDHFATREQIEYGYSVVARQIDKEVSRWAKGLEFEIKPPRSSTFGIGMSMKVETGTRTRIRYYREKQLETEVVCDQCGLKYAIYGVFGFCPDCGSHNSLLILDKNLELIEKMLGLADAQDAPDLRTKLFENALEDCVSAFDGWGRATLDAFRHKSQEPEKAAKVSFQNLVKATVVVKKLFNYDLAAPLEAGGIGHVVRVFQKRHLIAHRSGVVDEAYIEATGDHALPVGRKVVVSPKEIREVLKLLQTLARGLVEHLKQLESRGHE